MKKLLQVSMVLLCFGYAESVHSFGLSSLKHDAKDLKNKAEKDAKSLKKKAKKAGKSLKKDAGDLKKKAKKVTSSKVLKDVKKGAEDVGKGAVDTAVVAADVGIVAASVHNNSVLTPETINVPYT